MSFKSNSEIELIQKNGRIDPERAKNAEIAGFKPPQPLLPTVQVNEFLPAVNKWLIFGGMVVVAALAAAVPVAAVLKYKTTVQAQSTVRPAGELRLVQAATQGKIQEIRVKSGQKVKRGDVIATIDRSNWLTKQNQLKNSIKQQQLQLRQLNAQLGTFDGQIVAESARNQAMVTAAQAELAGSRRTLQDKQTKSVTDIAELQAKLRSTVAALQVARAKATRYQAIEQKGAITKNQVEEAQLAVKQLEQELVSNQASLKRGQAALNPNQSEVTISERRIAQEQNSGQAALARLNREKKVLIQQQIEANKQLQQQLLELQQVKVELQQTIITATADGIIAQLKLRNRDQTVQPGQEIAQIAPSNTPLEIRAAVLPSDVGKLKKGQNVQMRVSACAYTDYGTIKGRVSQISQDTLKTPTGDPAGSGQEASKTPAVYEVTIAPEHLTLGKEKNQCSLQLGMEGRADIVTKEESVLNFLLRKARLLVDI
jgi:HlyD family type I secretion membrane fusion protein